MANSTHSRKNLILYPFLFIFIAIFSLISFPFAVNKNFTVLAEDSSLGKLKIHFIDVGQGDAIFFELPDGCTMLIDAGPSGSKKKLIEYINNLNVSKINYLILTHSDSDHVGGMLEVLDQFEVQNIYRPFVLSSSAESALDDELYIYREDNSIYVAENTSTYNKFIKAAYNETYNGELANIFINYDGLVIPSINYEYSFMFEFHTPPKSSNKSTNSNGLRAIGYPTKIYESSNQAYNKNAVSPIISLSYESKKYMFAGDSNELNEPDFIKNLPTSGAGASSADACRNVDILKVAHHGSATSSTQDFLDIVNPKYAVICVKEGSYSNLPADTTIARLNALWSDDLLHILRTDLNGDIVASSSGNNLEFEFMLDGKKTSMNAENGIQIQVSTDEENKDTVPKWIIYIIVAVALLIIIIGIIIKIKRAHESVEKKIKRKQKNRKRKRGMRM